MTRAAQDVLGVLRGMQIVAEAICREQCAHSKHIWANSSIRELFEQNLKQAADNLRTASKQPSEELKKLQYYMQDTSERTFVVAKGIQKVIEAKMTPTMLTTTTAATNAELDAEAIEKEVSQTAADMDNRKKAGIGGGNSGSDSKQIGSNKQAQAFDAANLDISSITLKELEEILSTRSNVNLHTMRTKTKQIMTTTPKMPPTNSKSKIDFASSDDNKFAKPDVTEIKQKDTLDNETIYVRNVLSFVAGASNTELKDIYDTSERASGAAAAPSKNIDLPELSKVAKQRRVPSSRIGRMASFGGLFAGLGLGTLNELTKGVLGLGGTTNMREAVLSPANAERIVDTLCKVRGAALKIGQILSIQDSNVVSPLLTKTFERVRHAADYMPNWQVERVMNTQLGANWRDKFANFDDRPFAAASIGQVHRATLHDNGMQVAIKIQYPGVAQSIESDIDNLVGMLKVWNVFPQGFFINNIVHVAKRELNWEVDYMREADYTVQFKKFMAQYEEYYVPTVIHELTTSSVLTTELVPGVPLDKCFDMPYEHRKHIAESVLKLCLRELFEFECMQTDPNWSNFLYDAASKRLMLIDFGSARLYDHQFIKNYRHIIMCAANNDRPGVLEMSRQMGFLTGYESKQMENAHLDAVMILGEIFRYNGDFDFGKQNTTERLAQLVPTMVTHRLCPPPEEIYSIHRKLSGIFLLCARLNVSFNCRRFYDEIILNKFKA